MTPALTFSRSMASSLPGLNMMRSCRLAMDPARLDKAESDGDGLMPVMALVTVERSSCESQSEGRSQGLEKRWIWER